MVFVPFALLPGIVGAFFKPLALTMALSLGVSLVLSVGLVPWVLGRQDKPLPKPGAWRRRISEAYGATTRRLLKHRWMAVLLLAALLLGGFELYRTLGTDFLPSMDEGAIILDYWSPPGTSLTDTNAMLDQAEKVILALPDVATYSRRTGTQLGFFVTEPNRGDYVIQLKPRSERRPVDDVIEDLRAKLASLEPALHTDFGQLLEDNIGDLTGGVPQPIDVKLFGFRTENPRRQGPLCVGAVSKVRGVADVFDGVVIAGPSLDIRVRPEAIAREGLSTQDIQAVTAPALLGTVAGQLRVADRLYDLRVLASHAGPLASLPVRAGKGAMLPLDMLATVGTGAPETEIDRENLASYVGVTARLNGRDLGSAIGEIRSKIRTSGVLPRDISVRFGGQYEQQQASFRSLLYVLLGGLVLVAVLVLVLFGELRVAGATVVTALAALTGSLGALWLTGMTLNISSYVGAIMMVGIVGENAIFVAREAKLALDQGLSSQQAWSSLPTEGRGRSR